MSVLPQNSPQSNRAAYHFHTGMRNVFFFCFYYWFKVVPAYLCSFLPQSVEVPWFPHEKLTRKYNLCLPRSLTFPEKRNRKIRTWRAYGKNTVSGLSSRKVPAFFIRMRCPDGVQAQKSLSTCLAPALTKPTTFWTNLGPRAFPLKTHLQGKSPGDKVDLWASAEEKVAPE